MAIGHCPAVGPSSQSWARLALVQRPPSGRASLAPASRREQALQLRPTNPPTTPAPPRSLLAGTLAHYRNWAAQLQARYQLFNPDAARPAKRV